MLRPESPRVSVVLIFLDGERFLQEAIESVLGQTYPNWELLLVDDGSTDGSPELARAWVDRDPGRVRYLEHPGHQNRGTSATRNLGLRECRGSLVAFLDSDDVWVENKLASQVEILESQREVAMCYCRSLVWFSWDEAADRRDFLPPSGVPESRVVHPPNLLPLLISNTGRPPLPSSMMLRAEAARAVGGFEEDFPDLFDDQVFTAKIAAHYPVWASDACCNKYRQNASSITASNRRVGQTRMALARRRYLDWLASYFESISLADVRVWREWCRQDWMYRHFRGADSATVGSTRHDGIRWVKKWILKLEERTLPEVLRDRIWCRLKTVERV